MIVALQSGHSFAAACAALESRHPGADVAALLGTALSRWMQEELLTGIRFRR